MKTAVETLLAWVLLLLVLVATAFVLIVPALDHLSTADARIADLERTVAAFRARAGDGGTPEKVVVDEDALLPAGKPALAAAMLQEALVAIGTDAGVEVTRVRIREPVADTVLTRIGLSVSLTGNIEAFADFLYVLETERPYFLIKEMELSRGRGVGGGALDVIMAEIEVTGFIVPSAPPGDG